MPFLFGVAGESELPGRALVRLLGDLGLTEAAGRALVARMRRDGQLTGERRGGRAYYRLAGGTAAGFARIKSDASAGAPEWTGRFHALLYQVPESERAYRDALRRTALLTGYGLLQQGVLIALTDRSAHLGPLLDPPQGVRLRTAEIAMTDDEAARAAYDAWDLGTLDAAFAAHAAAMDAALEPAGGGSGAGAGSGALAADAEALRTFNRLLGAALVDTLRAPRLPERLQPPGWSLPRLHAAIGKVHRVYGGPAAAYVRGVLAEEGTPAPSSVQSRWSVPPP
ncbi:hypothetical protein [Nonomuraea pusilla]|uniref:Transcriptional regulator, PaaX family n=1 Tax=Nonomuraea pusilla TaxID=46177 RepID=A0A1H7Y154_9ACTN|nr:hypothetical protein [Nonomuraea pusilla]SEM39087.1 transcriptional regulator, PaaX family [Nonomuraea pusilla]